MLFVDFFFFCGLLAHGLVNCTAGPNVGKELTQGAKFYNSFFKTVVAENI
jgi:hypothetical protein